MNEFTNEMMIKFKARNENVAFARAIVVSFLMNLNMNLNVISEVKTLVSEAVTNAIIHGYQNDSSQDVEMHLAYDDRKIIIDVIDYGVGIPDLEKAKEPLYSSLPDEERAGLGFTIMEVFSDDFEIESSIDEGTKVHMVKKYENFDLDLK